MQVKLEPYIRIRIPAALEQQEVLAALLSGDGCYAFEHHEHYLDAYALRDGFDESTIREIVAGQGLQTEEISGIPHENWNAQWEASYAPVFVGQEWEIRAPFHEPKPGYRFSIIIQPKMAFGTGHHYTTRLMLSAITHIPMTGMDVLDMGCGSAVLGIAAAKLGARKVTGIEIESWSCENAMENVQSNDVAMNIEEGTAARIGDRTFDRILANIQRNVLTEDAPIYARALRPGGYLLVSGFFDFDEEHIRRMYVAEGLEQTRTDMENGWCMVMFRKPDTHD